MSSGRGTVVEHTAEVVGLNPVKRFGFFYSSRVWFHFLPPCRVREERQRKRREKEKKRGKERLREREKTPREFITLESR